MVQGTELEKTEHLAKGCKMAKSLKVCYKACKKEMLPQAGHVSCMGMAEKNSCLKTVTYERLRREQEKCHRGGRADEKWINPERGGENWKSQAKFLRWKATCPRKTWKVGMKRNSPYRHRPCLLRSTAFQELG